MSDIDVQAELWKVGNVVTAFAIVQSLAFAFGLGDKLHSVQAAPPWLKGCIAVTMVFFNILYCWAVHKSAAVGMSFVDNPKVKKVWRDMTLWRCGAIAAFALLSIGGMFVPHQESPQSPPTILMPASSPATTR